MSNIIQAFPKGNGGGHTILDTDGVAVDQKKKLQFTGLDVSNDSTNEKTEVKAVGLNTDSLNDIIQSASVQGNAVAGNGFVYSTTEQIVGKWIDGKPVYQKTIMGTFASSGTAQDINHNIPNLDQAINVLGYLESVDGSGNTYNIPVGFYNGIQYFGVFFTKTKMCARLQNIYLGTNYKITVQYLKTTD